MIGESIDSVEQGLKELLSMSEGGNAVVAWEKLTELQRRALQIIYNVEQNQIPQGEKVYGVREEIIARVFNNSGVFVTVFANPQAIPEEQDIY